MTALTSLITSFAALLAPAPATTPGSGSRSPYLPAPEREPRESKRGVLVRAAPVAVLAMSSSRGHLSPRLSQNRA